MKAFMFVGFLAFILVLSACSSQSGGNSGDSEGEVTLTIGSWRTEDKGSYQKVIDKFNEENPDINVEFKPSKNTEYNTILNTALQSGEGPDIIHLRPYTPGIELADAGYLEPLDGLEGLDQYPEETLSASKGSDDKQYGVPLNISTTQMFYNKKIFDDLGLEEPQTWDELKMLSEKIKDEGITPISLGTKEGWLLSLSHGIIGPAHYGGNEFVDKITAGETDFTSDEFQSSIDAMDEIKQFFPKNYKGLGMEDIRTMFFTGDAAMFPLGSWEIEVLREMNPELELGFFPMPSAVGKEPTITTWVDGSYAINANSEHKEAAKKFLQFMTTEEFGTMFTEEFKMISAIPGIESEDELVNALGKAVEEQSTPYMMLVHFAGGNPSTKATIETELQGMYLGERTPEEVANAVQESAKSWYEPLQ
ncbi:ABC transporter substrate-binding protein [Pseudalkalibacillus hwajinpoensis]|uniref:Extracellular solute-binding protein n=1 Tax=Guptibacillus hwajinpoensis TaxID=208199 RepID=A0A4U1MKI4_9BACL|nr:extracellular solute-binding protein [Pseudalkalibacillus hwajinpoensis]TKD71096.1 extracellular solute-binding protein [Pseudalkalibacillus hwajinpoensis]